MFGLMRNFYRYLKHRKELGVTVALLGIDNAGKSSVLACMKGEYQEFIAPTIGFTSEVIKHGHHTVKVFDLGGGANIRGIWSRYYAELHGAVFVVDASDRSKLPVARDVLHQAMENPRFANKPLLIMANKQDKVEPMSSADVASNLGLDKLKGLQFHVIVCSALMEEGKSPDARILQGLKWLISTIDSNYAPLQKRIQKDSDAQKEEERIEREEKRKRVEARRRERELEREKQEKEDKEKVGMDTIIEMNTLPGNTVTVITENPPTSSRSAKDVMKSESLKGFSKNAVVPLELIEKGREDTIDSGLPGHTMHGSEKTPRSSTPRSNGTPRNGWAHGSEITPRGTTPRTGTPRSSVYASTTIVVGHQTEGSVSESPSNAESNADQAIPRSKSPDSFTVQVQEQEDRHLPVSTGSPRKSSSVLPPLAAKAKLETAPSPTIQGLHPLPRLEKPAFV